MILCVLLNFLILEKKIYLDYLLFLNDSVLFLYNKQYNYLNKTFLHHAFLSASTLLLVYLGAPVRPLEGAVLIQAE